MSCKQQTECSYTIPVDKNDGLKVSMLEEHNLDRKTLKKSIKIFVMEFTVICIVF